MVTRGFKLKCSNKVRMQNVYYSHMYTAKISLILLSDIHEKLTNITLL